MDHVCIRIYANGSARYSVRDADGATSWLSHNLEFRPGNTLVVDGEVISDTGYLSGAEKAAVIDFVLSRDLPDPNRRPLKPEWNADLRRKVATYPEDGVLVSDFEGMEFLERYRRGLARNAVSPRM